MMMLFKKRDYSKIPKRMAKEWNFGDFIDDCILLIKILVGLVILLVAGYIYL